MNAWRWRPMLMADATRVCAIGDQVHAAYPERDEIFLEKLQLWPRGCLVLESEAGILGYGVSHPWYRRRPPKLDQPLGALPANPETYYVHDVALLPQARGLGAGASLLRRLEIHARALGLAEMSLIAVYEAPTYWSRQGFQPILDDPDLPAAMTSYKDGATYMERQLTKLAG